MADNKYPQFVTQTLKPPIRSEFELRPQNGVGQDRSAPARARTLLVQPSRATDARRAQPSDTNSDRLKKHSTRRQTVQAIGWVKQPISDEIDRIARHFGQTRSHTIATLLEEAVHQRLHVEHAVMLSPLVRKAVLKAVQGLLPFLVQIAYDTNQTRHLTGNVLANTVPPADMARIREKTAKHARDSILHQRPQITELIDIAKTWFADLDQREEADPG